MEKVMIFIDGANLLHGCKNYKDKYQVDLLKLRDALVGGRRLIRAYYYGSFIPDAPNYESQIKFFDFLEYKGFKVIKSPLRKRTVEFECKTCGATHSTEESREKGVDIALATDMLSFGINDHYDTAIVVSGDYDYYRAIEEVQRNGKNVEIAYFKKSGISDRFIRCADKFISLDEISGEIEKI